MNTTKKYKKVLVTLHYTAHCYTAHITYQGDIRPLRSA